MIKIEDVAGPVDAESKTGTIKVEGAEGTVTVTGGTGDFTVADVRGPVRVTAATGRLQIRNVKPHSPGPSSTLAVSAHIATGFIHIQDVTGDVQATTGTGTVKVTDVRGTVNAHSKVGQVVLDQIERPCARIEVSDLSAGREGGRPLKCPRHVPCPGVGLGWDICTG